MPSITFEKKLLQTVIAVACLVPLFAGITGVSRGLFGSAVYDVNLDSHFRYLSGLLLAIGFGFLSTIIHIEQHTARFRLLACIVFTGGMCRLLGMLMTGGFTAANQAALLMELVVTPLLCFWQFKLAQRYAI